MTHLRHGKRSRTMTKFGKIRLRLRSDRRASKPGFSETFSSVCVYLYYDRIRSLFYKVSGKALS